MSTKTIKKELFAFFAMDNKMSKNKEKGRGKANIYKFLETFRNRKDSK